MNIKAELLGSHMYVDVRLSLFQPRQRETETGVF